MSITWQQLVRPALWQPDVGDELVGYYIGRTVRHGKFGQYEVALIAVPVGDGLSHPRMVSGAALLQLLDGSSVATGRFVRIVFSGTKELKNGHKMKTFEVFAAEGSITVDEARAYLDHLVQASEQPEAA